MKRVKTLVSIFAFSLLVLALPAIASAQWNDRDRDRDDDYNRNGRYNRNIENTIDGLNERAKRFARSLDRELDRSRYDDRRAEDRLNNLADDFRKATDRLEDVYDNGRNNNRSEDQARRVLQLGQQLGNALRRMNLSYNVQNEWNQIQRDLNIVSNEFGNNRNNRNRNNGRWRDRLPVNLPW
jgi:chromosome segregation ATPase